MSEDPRGTAWKPNLKLCQNWTLLYGSEWWRMTASDFNKLSIFHTKSLWKTQRIFWPNTTSNDSCLLVVNTAWRPSPWGSGLCMCLGKKPDNITHTALQWTPEVKHKRGRLKKTWQQTVKLETKTLNYTWGTIQRLSQNRQKWLSFMPMCYMLCTFNKLIS